MWNLIRYSFLTKVRNRSLIFWPLLFPLALTTLMYFSVGQAREADFETIQAACVQVRDVPEDPEDPETLEDSEEKGMGEEKQESSFREFLRTLEEESDLIRTRDMDETEAIDTLREGRVSGIFYDGEEPSLTVSSNGLPQTILQMILESYAETSQTMEKVALLHPEGLEAAVEAMEQRTGQVSQVSLGGRTTNGNAQLFYALLGMACLYGSFIGFKSAMELQANLTPLAARRCAGPSHRMQMVMAELLVSFALHFANIMILLCYMKYILRLEFAGSGLEMLPVLLAGSMIGVAMGMFITSMGRMGEGVKIGIMVGVSMVMSFLAGMMNPQVKRSVDESAALINRLNPAALISDAMYCVNVYDSPKRYGEDLLILAVMCVVLTAGTFLIIRRERYDSI